MIRNRVGQPVQGEDFFGRETEQGSCWECLEGDHLLLLAPRRVGKTSLMLKLKDDAEGRGYEASYLSGADAQDEAAFVRKLYEAVKELTAWGGVWQRLCDGPVGQRLGGIERVEAAGFSVDFGSTIQGEWALLGEKLAKAVDQHEGRCLLLVDELPIFVLSLLREDPSGERARRFLTWFRGLRQRSGMNGALRWLLAGSIGLDTVTARLNLGDTINDLRIVHLGPFPDEVADSLLLELSRSHRLPLPEAVRAHILRRIGWTIPYYLQLVFAELRDHCRGKREADTAAVDEVIENLLKPAKKGYFDYWRQRLSEELGKVDAGHAMTLLNAVAADQEGASRSTLAQSLGPGISAPEERKEKLRYLLDVLESDGYIQETLGADRFCFRSPLLREFWVRRVLP